RRGDAAVRARPGRARGGRPSRRRGRAGGRAVLPRLPDARGWPRTGAAVGFLPRAGVGGAGRRPHRPRDRRTAALCRAELRRRVARAREGARAPLVAARRVRAVPAGPLAAATCPRREHRPLGPRRDGRARQRGATGPAVTDDAALLLEQEERRSPGAVELATFLSLAVHVEPELLRAVRLRLLPSLDASDEADLWFGGLVDSRGSSGVAFVPEVAELLRTRLRARLLAGGAGLVEEARALVREFHAETSPALVLEEELAWLAVSAPGDVEAIERLLASALVALVGEGRAGIAYWAGEALAR